MERRRGRIFFCPAVAAVVRGREENACDGVEKSPSGLFYRPFLIFPERDTIETGREKMKAI
jgi:hypothetical protein